VTGNEAFCARTACITRYMSSASSWVMPGVAKREAALMKSKLVGDDNCTTW
jgi:hypothetical protein